MPLPATHGEEETLRLSFFDADWMRGLGKEQIKDSNKRTGTVVFFIYLVPFVWRTNLSFLTCRRCRRGCANGTWWARERSRGPQWYPPHCRGRAAGEAGSHSPTGPTSIQAYKNQNLCFYTKKKNEENKRTTLEITSRGTKKYWIESSVQQTPLLS